MKSAPTIEPVAIIGMGCRFPGAADPVAFWKLLCDGKDAISTVPADRWDADEFYDADPAAVGKMNSKHGGFLEAIDQFDSEFFGIAPREADLIDPQHRLLMEVAWEALHDAAIAPASLAKSATGVFMGLASANYSSLLFRDHGMVGPFNNSGGSGCIAANRISYMLDLSGPSLAVDTACSSSLNAVHLACQSLWTGESELALAGGANVILIPGPSISLAKARVLSPDGRCRVFDANANGFGRGEGAGVVVLKLLSRALADGDPIHAVIRGSATQQSGRTNGLMAPSRWATEAVVREACRRAGIAPSMLNYIEAHSSGTLIGDAAELNALAAVLGKEKCPIGSVKTNIGHLEAASGIAGLIKTVLMLKHRKLAPSLHFKMPNPHVQFDAMPLRIPRQMESLPDNAIAGVSASGYGGVNVHVVVESAPPATTSRRSALPPHRFERQRHWLSAEPQSGRAEAPDVDTEDLSSTQRTLSRIWQQILGVKQVSMTDNFFALGGGSLMVMELFAKIEDDFGLSLPPTLLFERPTLGQLAEAIESRSPAGATPLLVTFRNGSSGRPIFLIGPDHLFHFIGLLKRLDSQRPLYGLQPPYMDGFRKRGITIEDMAEAYLKELERVCPEEVPHLIGLCAGGIVAYEMAQRMLARGRRVGLVAMIDAPCPAINGERRMSRPAYFISRCRTHLHELRRHDLRDAMQYIALRARLMAGTAVSPIWRSAGAPARSDALASIANRAAIYRYRPQPYPGPIDLFNADEPYPSPAEDTRLRWRELSPQVRVHNSPGAHHRILIEPEVSNIAEKLRYVLAESEV